MELENLPQRDRVNSTRKPVPACSRDCEVRFQCILVLLVPQRNCMRHSPCRAAPMMSSVSVSVSVSVSL